MRIVFANTLLKACHKLQSCDIDVITDSLLLVSRRLMSSAYLRAGMVGGDGSHPCDNIALTWLARELQSFSSTICKLLLFLVQKGE